MFEAGHRSFSHVMSQPMGGVKRERVESDGQTALFLDAAVDAEIQALYSSQVDWQQQQQQQHPLRKMHCGGVGVRRRAPSWDFSFADIGTPSASDNMNKALFSFDDAVPPAPGGQHTDILFSDAALLSDVAEFGFQPLKAIKHEDTSSMRLLPNFNEYRPCRASDDDTDCSSGANSGASTPTNGASSPRNASVSASASVPKRSNNNRSGGRARKHVERKKWTKEEDRLLAEAVKQHGDTDFSVVAVRVKSRNTTQCRMRWMHAIRPGIRKGYWKEAEDNKLRVWVKAQLETLTNERITMQISTVPATVEDIDWNCVEGYIKGRSIKQCRERWKKNLSPTLKKGHWMPHEDAHIVNEQLRVGNKWAEIARKLPGRTEHAVKTRWQSLLRVCKRHWTEQEDGLLLQLREDMKVQGRTWDDIVSFFPNRTKNAIMTRFKVLKRHIAEAATTKAK